MWWGKGIKDGIIMYMENIPTTNEYGFTPEEWEAMDPQMREGIEMAASFEQEHPELFAPVDKVPYTPEIAVEIEQRFSDFEARFPLDQLLAIKTEAEARTSLFRLTAVDEMGALQQFIRKIVSGTILSSEEEASIDARWTKIELAVGGVNGGVCRHD